MHLLLRLVSSQKLQCNFPPPGACDCLFLFFVLVSCFVLSCFDLFCFVLFYFCFILVSLVQFSFLPCFIESLILSVFMFLFLLLFYLCSVFFFFLPFCFVCVFFCHLFMSLFCFHLILLFICCFLFLACLFMFGLPQQCYIQCRYCNKRWVGSAPCSQSFQLGIASAHLEASSMCMLAC